MMKTQSETSLWTEAVPLTLARAFKRTATLALCLFITMCGRSSDTGIGHAGKYAIPDSSAIVHLLSTRYSIEHCFLNSYRTPGDVRGVRAGGFARESTSEMMFEFFEENRDVFVIANPREEIVIVRGGGDSPTGRHIKFGQRFKGLDVFGTGGALYFDTSCSTFHFTGRLLPNSGLSVSPKRNSNEAERSALQFIRPSRPRAIVDSPPKLEIYAMDSTPILAWSVKVRFEPQQELEWGMIYHVSAEDGQILDAEQIL